MMNKEEFLSFLQDSLNELAKEGSKSYDAMSVPVDLLSSEDEVDYSDEPSDDEDDDFDIPVSIDKPVTQPQQTGNIFDIPLDVKKDIDLSQSFTEDLFKNLYNRFKPSQEVKNEVFNKTQPFENIPTERNTINFCGSPFTYTRYEKPMTALDDVVLNSTGDLEASILNFRKILEIVMNELEVIYGGSDRITDIAIVSDVVIINKVSFEPLLKDSLIKSLPVDLQYAVRSGCFAYLLDYSYLVGYKNLVNIKIDNVDFMFTKVRIDLGLARNFEPKDMFKICKKLNVLQVGENVITRKNIDSCDDIFHRVRKSTELADKCEKLGFVGTKASWGCVRDIFMKPESKLLWKGVKLATMVGVASTVSVATVGFKLTRFLGNTGKKAISGVGSILDAVKENS